MAVQAVHNMQRDIDRLVPHIVSILNYFLFGDFEYPCCTAVQLFFDYPDIG